MSKTAKIVLSKSILIVKNLSKNINLGDHYFFQKIINSIFEPFYFLKVRPIFDRLSSLVGFKKKILGGMLILGKKLAS